MKSRIQCWAVMLIGFALLATLTPSCPVPGLSASWAAQALGLDPFPTLSNPLWFFAAGLVERIPFGSAVQRLNLLSAFFGAVSLGLLFTLARSLRHDLTFRLAPQGNGSAVAAAVSGWAAVMILLTSTSFLIVSTRAHPETLGMALALGAVTFVQRGFGDAASALRRLFLAALLWGFACTELSGCVVATPVLAVGIFMSLLRSGSTSWRAALVGAFGWLLGLLPLLGLAISFMHQEAYAWRGFTGLPQVLYYILQNYLQAIFYSVPRVGWLNIFLFALVPWFVLFAFRPLQPRPNAAPLSFGTLLLHMVLTAILVLLLLDAPIAPWAITGGHVLLVTPYLVIALWGGYLAGHWYVLLSNPARDSGWRGRVGVMLSRILPASLIGLAVVRCVPHLKIIDVSGAVAVQRFARQVLDDAASSRYLVSGTAIDDIIRIEAQARGLPIRLLSPARGGSGSAYNRYLASWYPDDPRLKGIAQIGFMPLTRELIARSGGPGGDVAILSNPDFWYANSLTPWPAFSVFVRTPSNATGQLDAVFEQHRKRWAQWHAPEDLLAETTSLIAPWRRIAYTHVSRVANNLGVLLEDAGRDDQAALAYREARAIDPGNLSALMNLHALQRRAGSPEAKATETELKVALEKLSNPRAVWALAEIFGYLRNPEVYARRGFAWAASGRPNLGLFEMKKALQMAGGDETAERLALGNVLFASQQTADAERKYREILAANPNHREALLGLIKAALLRRDWTGATEYLNRLEAIPGGRNQAGTYRAAILAEQGRYPEAIKLIKGLAEKDEQNPAHWVALMDLAQTVGDETLRKDAEQKIRKAPRLSAELRLALARLALRRQDREAARQELEWAIRENPADRNALELMLTMSVEERRMDLAERAITALLSIDPDHPLANYVLGTIQISRGQYPLAQASLETSLARRRDAGVLNDLAWVLYLQKNDRAESVVREAIGLEPNNPVALDTLGAILLERGDLAGAEKALTRSIELKPGNPESIFRLARVYGRTGRGQEAVAMTEKLLQSPAILPKPMQDDMRAFADQIKSGKN